MLNIAQTAMGAWGGLTEGEDEMQIRLHAGIAILLFRHQVTHSLFGRRSYEAERNNVRVNSDIK